MLLNIVLATTEEHPSRDEQIAKGKHVSTTRASTLRPGVPSLGMLETFDRPDAETPSDGQASRSFGVSSTKSREIARFLLAKIHDILFFR